MVGAPGQGQDPRAIDKRRLMPYVLPMTTCQISHPVAIFILVISDDRLLHFTALPSLHFFRLAPRLALLKRQFTSMSSRKILPVLLLILIEASDEYHMSVKVAKL